jgi:chromosome segregation ATPase
MEANVHASRLIFTCFVCKTQKELEESHAAVEASKEEYNTLKERTKVVASELKERRAACRTLASEVDVLKSNNSNLQDQMTQMQGESLDMNQSSQVNEQELNTLKSQLMDIKKELEEARAGIQKVAEKGEEALTSYKKKAQQSLAVANARAANAAQAREEAEMESRAARSTADKAMERALMAEQNGKEAQAKAKLYVTDMEKEVAKYSEVKEALEKATSELEQVRAESKSLTETNAKQTCELQSVSGRFEASQKTVEDLNKELSESQTRSNELFEETERLRHEVQRLKDDFQRLSLAMESNDAEEKKDYMEQAKQVSLNSEAEATISMLRQELHDANIAIKELKETLIATVEESEAALSNPQSQPSPPMNGDGGGGIPLFYAMEKQAELTQARNEITRLANLLGDSETDKQEAMDSMQEMERRMNEAMAKLKRQEQHDKFSPQEEQVNMEYLKNVTLSFVKAATVVEKKALLPVIGTVLCLTPEEQSRAMEALDKNGSGVMESVTSSVMSLGWGS